jgi:hypothetical protein
VVKNRKGANWHQKKELHFKTVVRIGRKRMSRKCKNIIQNNPKKQEISI